MPTVDLSVGHGTKPDGTHDPGASGGGTDEQQAGDILVAACAERLSDFPISVTSVETYTDDPNYVGSVERINGSEPDLAVTFHHDWSGAPEGAFCHWYADGTDGQRAADHIIRAVSAAGFSIRTSWHRERPGLYFLSHTTVTAVLVEAGRIGQYSEPELRTFGEAAAEGIAGYFGIEPVMPHEEDDMLKRGDRGPRVRTLQARLTWYANADLEWDGIYGPATEDAVKTFQRDTGIFGSGETPDGKFTATDWAVLREVAAKGGFAKKDHEHEHNHDRRYPPKDHEHDTDHTHDPVDHSHTGTVEVT